MISFNVELNNRFVGESRLQNLLLRITVNRKHARIALMYSINSSSFNPKGKGGKYVRSSHPEHVQINNHIEEKIQQAKSIITELEKEESNNPPNNQGQNT
jgi:hypothetical protein